VIEVARKRLAFLHMSTTPDREVFAAILEPLVRRPLGDVGFIGEVVDGVVECRLPVLSWPAREQIETELRAAGARDIQVRAMTDPERDELRLVLRGANKGVLPVTDRKSSTRILGISSGKGGVGKSSVTVNLALALQSLGHSVAILDADVYGFSVPRMLGDVSAPIILGDMVLPTVVHGLRCISMGYFVDDDQPVLWRGPMLHKAINQLITEVWWDAPDFLLIDMPPGTGDVALTISEVVPHAEMYVVTTPQAAAQRVAQRSALAAKKLRLSVRGVIENMGGYVDSSGNLLELFGAGGGATLAADLETPLLGTIPFDVALRHGGDVGAPLMVTDPNAAASRAFRAVAERIAALGPTRIYKSELLVR